MSPKTGRPTVNPRPHKLSVRLNDKSVQILDTYCKKENVSKTDAVERAIKSLESEIKK